MPQANIACRTWAVVIPPNTHSVLRLRSNSKAAYSSGHSMWVFSLINSPHGPSWFGWLADPASIEPTVVTAESETVVDGGRTRSQTTAPEVATSDMLNRIRPVRLS